MSAASRYNLAPIPSSLVFSIYADCIGLFDQIIAFQSSGLRGESIKKGLLKEAHDKVQEQLGRLRLWAAKVEGLYPGRVSIDQRLCDSPATHTRVNALLNQLYRALGEVLALYKQSQVEIEVHFSNKSDSGDDEADDMDDDEENEEEDKKEGHRDNEDYEQDGRDLLNELDARYEHTETEFDQYLAGVGHIITTLFRFVSAIHHPSTHDRPVWYSEVTDPTVRELDKVYIRAQFAEAEKWLIERLGQANMERRRMILPRLLHAGHDLNEQGFAMIKSPIHLSRGVQYPRLGDGSRLDSFICPLYGIGDVDSEPSILESGTEVDNERLLVLPSAISGKERHGSDSMGICPYCLRVTDQSSWRSHVYAHLKPYCCTLTPCPQGDQLFHTAHDWFNHELEFHRREWTCRICSEDPPCFSSRELLQAHFQEFHRTTIPEDAMESTLNECEHSARSLPQTCSLCSRSMPIRELEGHLSHHMRYLALDVIRTRAERDAYHAAVERQVEEMLLIQCPSSSTLDIAHDLGIVFWLQGQFGNALKWYQRVLDGKLKTLGKEHPSTLDTAHSMAIAFDNQGNYEDALQWYQYALDGREKTLGENDPSTLDTIHCMGVIFERMGEYEKALAWYERALKSEEITLGKDHSATLATVHCMATIFDEQGQYEKAQKWCQRAWEGYVKAHGKDHPFTLNAVNSMAVILNHKGEYGQATEWHKRALQGYDRVHGTDHPSTLSAISNIAAALANQGETDEALEWYRWALKGKKKTLGIDHPSTLHTIHGIAMIFEGQGKPDDALKWSRRALKGKERALGYNHPSTLNTVQGIAKIVYHQGKYEEALEWYRRAMEGYEKAFGEDHPSTLSATDDMAIAMGVQGRHDEALKWHRRALKGYEKVYGKDHPSTLKIASNIAAILVDQGKGDEALDWHRAVLEVKEKTLMNDNRSALLTVNQIDEAPRNKERKDSQGTTQLTDEVDANGFAGTSGMQGRVKTHGGVGQKERSRDAKRDIENWLRGIPSDTRWEDSDEEMITEV